VIGENMAPIEALADDPDRTEHDVALVLLEVDVAMAGGIEQHQPHERRARAQPGAEVRDQRLAFVIVAGDRHAALRDGRIELRRHGKPLHLADHVPRPCDQRRATLGRADAVALADEQRIAQHAAQPLDRVADGGLVDVEPLRRSRERLQIVHQYKRPQAPDVDRIDR